MMNRKRIQTFAVAMLLLFGSLSGSVQARSVLPSAGRAVNAADSGCFALSYSHVQNTCTSVKRLEIPLFINESGTKTVRVTAQASSYSNLVTCIAVGRNKEGTMTWSSGWKNIPSYGPASDIVLSVYGPPWGSIYASCDVHPGGWVNMVNWN